LYFGRILSRRNIKLGKNKAIEKISLYSEKELRKVEYVILFEYIPRTIIDNIKKRVLIKSLYI
jgi:hypothetical protein